MSIDGADCCETRVARRTRISQRDFVLVRGRKKARCRILRRMDRDDKVFKTTARVPTALLNVKTTEFTLHTRVVRKYTKSLWTVAAKC